jgi:predicted ArsR family transcriptional regulator
LLADGRPTREIAERLYLSPKTVERHISNLATKVGVAGRAQLVAFAAAWAARTRPAERSTGDQVTPVRKPSLNSRWM